MPTFYDSNGTPYALSIEIGRGGEGTVFYCPNDLSLVAKIYHEAIDEEKSEKLRWMAANRNDGLLKVAAWIVDTLHDQPNGKIVGFLMPNVKAKEIHELYSLKSRRVHFPEATWQFLIHSATNVARAFYSLHKNDHIMGDVNHGNCVVLADGTVKLIDCDSYSIRTDKTRYRCEVGVATHLAPELQGIDLSEVEREKNHDNFGLAVIIFQLLFLGRHPFAGNYLGAEDKTLEDCIREYRFAYGNEQLTNVKQPPGTLSLSQISPRLADLFNRAFLTQDRPEPREWIESLDDLSNSLKQCFVHIGHYYFQELTICPWCEIESKTGLILFPLISNENGEKGFNIFTIESLLNSLEIPRNLPAKPFKPKVLPPPSTEALELQNNARKRVAIFAVLHFVLVLIWTVLGGASSGIALGIFLGFGFYFINQKLTKDNQERLTDELDAARQNWNKLEGDWKNDKNQHLMDNDLSLIRQKITAHQSLQKEKIEQLANLKEDTAQYQLRMYLANYKLSDLNLKEDQKDALTRYGLLTVADIEEKRLSPMLALEAETKDDLLALRKKLEKRFKFNEVELPEVAKNRFEIELSEKRRKIEREIEQLLAALRLSSTMIRQHQQQLLAKSETFAQKLLQAESNSVAVPNNTQITAALVLITILVPTFGSIFQASAPLSPRVVVSDSDLPKVANRVNYRVEPAYEDDFKVNEKITEAGIAQMSGFEREKSAKTLHRQAIDLIEVGDLKNAEKKLRLAVKFVDYFVNIHYTLSNLLYDQEKYNESIQFLEKALAIEPENHNAKLLLGASYLKINNFKKGENIFLEVLAKNPESYEANFNLGAIYMNKKDYRSAKLAFEKAIRTESYSVDAVYEYGVCLTKLGDWQNAKEQYDFLARKDMKKAEQLWKIMTKSFPADRRKEAGTYVKVGTDVKIDETPTISYARK